MTAARSSVAITVAVWKALFLREAVSRLFGRRAAWLWLLMEPVAHVAFLMFVFSVARQRTVGGIHTAIFTMTGLLAFFMFRRTAKQSMNAVSANKALFAYRQVKPVDTVIVRAGLEGFLLILVSIILLAGAGLVGLPLLPSDPLGVLESVVGLWLFALGFGLLASVATELAPELGSLIEMSMLPLYFMSGVLFPISVVPEPYRSWLMFNPIAHGLEAVRLGFSPYYHAVAELSVPYLYAAALGALFLGLALHYRFARRLATI